MPNFAHKLSGMNIYLVGYMGSGKSTIGRMLSGRLGFEHIDLDDFFEETYRISIMDFFSKYDENAFRQIETRMLKKTLSIENHIISTGGGTPCFNNNMDLINAHGLSVYIRMHPKSLFTRLKTAKRPRPRTSALDDEALMKRILDDLEVRESFYKQAKLEVKGESIDVNALAGKIREQLRISGSAD